MPAVRRLLASTGLAGILGALAFAAPAQADLKALCILDAEAKAHTTKPQFKKYVQLIGGAGTFSLNSIFFSCIDLGAGKPPGTVLTGSTTVSGTFKNSVDVLGVPIDTTCGHAKLLGTVTGKNLFGNPKLNVLTGRKFAIELGPPYGPNGHGAFFWHALGPPSKNLPVPKVTTHSQPKPSTPKPFRYAGQVQLSPSTSKPDDVFGKALPNVTDKCTKAFHVNGAILVHEA